MSAIMPKPLKGKDVRVVIQGMERSDSTGAYTSLGSSFTVTGRAAELRVNPTTEWERTDADDAEEADRDWTKVDWTISLGALKLITGNAGDLEDIWTACKYVEIKIEWNRAGSNRPKYYYGGIQSLSFERAAGRMVDTLEVVRVAVGSDNPNSASLL